MVADLRGSGFTTVILWSIHVWCDQTDEQNPNNGDLYYNGELIVHNGEYVGDPAWPDLVGQLKTGDGTSVNRVEVSVGSGGVSDWNNIAYLINAQGTGSTSVLYRNFQALLAATGADAVDSDNEDYYDVDSGVAFMRMTQDLGYPNSTFVPFDNQDYWAALKASLGSFVDRTYVQCYAGGDINASAEALIEWSNQLDGMSVDPGLWCRHTEETGDTCASGDSPTDVHDTLSGWISESAPLSGGFIWLYDDIAKCAQQTGCTAANYAQAINQATGVRIPVTTR